MYLEQLNTPNPFRYPDAPRTPLLEACDFPAVHDRLQRSDLEPWIAARQVTKRLRHTIDDALHCPDKDNIKQWYADASNTVLEKMVQPDQQTDCLGFTIVGSEALSLAGIEHYIAYGRRHWFMIVAEHDQDPTQPVRARLQDFLLPEFNIDMTRSLTPTPRKPEAQDITTFETLIKNLHANDQRQQNAVFHTTAIAQHLGIPDTKLADQYPFFWGDPKTSQQNPLLPGQEVTPADRRLMGQLQWILSVYTPETGRKVIEQYAKFTTAMRAREFITASNALREMEGYYPENDCRAPRGAIRTLIGGLCAAKEVDIPVISATIEAYCSSIQTGDPRVDELRGDLYRTAASLTKDSAAAQHAIQAYQEAVSRSKISATYREACIGKQRAVTNYLQQPDNSDSS